MGDPSAAAPARKAKAASSSQSSLNYQNFADHFPAPKSRTNSGERQARPISLPSKASASSDSKDSVVANRSSQKLTHREMLARLNRRLESVVQRVNSSSQKKTSKATTINHESNFEEVENILLFAEPKGSRLPRSTSRKEREGSKERQTFTEVQRTTKTFELDMKGERKEMKESVSAWASERKETSVVSCQEKEVVEAKATLNPSESIPIANVVSISESQTNSFELFSGISALASVFPLGDSAISSSSSSSSATSAIATVLGPASAVDDLHKEEVVVPVHHVEEVALSLLEIIRSLFLITDDLEMRLECYLSFIMSYLPLRLQKVISDLYPLLKMIATVLEIVCVFLLIGVELQVEAVRFLWRKVRSHHPEYLLGMFFGVLFCFFGSFFCTTIAAFEAFRLFGYDRLLKSLAQIRGDLTNLRQSSRRFSQMLRESSQSSEDSGDKVGRTDDNNVSTKESEESTGEDPDNKENKDGTDNTAGGSSSKSSPDLLFRDDSERKRRNSVVLSSVYLAMVTINPHHFAQAVFVLNAGVLAVIATLKVQFAKTITLGNSISNFLEKPVMAVADPFVEAIFPSEVKQWGHFIIVLVLKFAAISVAWTLQKLIAAFHSSIRGGMWISRNLTNYLLVASIISDKHKITLQEYRSWIVYSLGYLFAACGLYFQLLHRQALPLPFNYLFFPFLFTERVLIWVVNNSNFLFHNM